MEFVENIAAAVDNKQFGLGLFVDLQKASERLDHSVLLQKCDRYKKNKRYGYNFGYFNIRVPCVLTELITLNLNSNMYPVEFHKDQCWHQRFFYST